ncbi:MAG: helix-turn-helix transcriptional regulator [Chloroflexi bacterium]|nr:helix-turn-helix transcriptional regulator [Chloroflexota bacterium]
MQNEIGLAIRLARVAVGKSQWQVARRVGVHPASVNHFERGKRVPDAETVRRLWNAIEIDAPKSPLVAMVLKESRKVVGAMYATS